MAQRVPGLERQGAYLLRFSGSMFAAQGLGLRVWGLVFWGLGLRVVGGPFSGLWILGDPDRFLFSFLPDTSLSC